MIYNELHEELLKGAPVPELVFQPVKITLRIVL